MHEDHIREGFAKHTALALVNASLDVCETGRVVISCPITDAITNQHDTVHAGVQCLLADTASGYTALSCAKQDNVDVVSVEFKMNCLAPARGTTLRAEATIVRPGARLAVCQAHVHAIDESNDETLVALMQSTMMIVPRS
ncbi:MAG: PaaI family thioesterase [Phycisphaerales bacterium JB043]